MRLVVALLLLVIAWCPAAVGRADEAVAGDVVAGNVPINRLIDEQIDAGFSKWGATAAARCSDAAFVRRVCIDLTGTIPTAQEAYRFIVDEDTDKRAQLVDRLLSTKQYALRMATFFDVAFMERRADSFVTTDEWRDYLATSFRSNKPLNQIAKEILGADGVDASLRPAAKFYLDRNVDKDILVRDIGRLFLGVDLQCAQCHDHPDIDDYLHQHYHGLSVFVAGSKTFKQPDGLMVLQEMVTREVEFASVFEPDITKKTGPRLIDALLEVPEFVEGEEYVEKPSRTVRAVPKFSLRELLAQRVADESPEYARNMANRLWAMLMGRGLVHPLDMHHSDNPPSHPELLDLLSKHLVDSRFDTRAFIREVTLSETYQRSSLMPDGVEPATVPPESFAVANMKGLSPEQLFESLLTANNANGILAHQIEASLADESADTTESADTEPADEEAEIARRSKQRAARIAEFVSIFGASPGQAEGEFATSLSQALFLANNEAVSAWLSPRLGSLSERLVSLAEPEAVAYELYLSVLSRLPEPEEIEIVREQLNAATAAERKTSVAELIWSLLASAEFQLNH